MADEEQTHPVINVEETTGKTVGRRTAAPRSMVVEGNTKEIAKAWQKALPVGGIPKGVYRFKTHEEADEWLIKMTARAAAKRS